MRRLTRPLLILLAIVFLIEAWLWRHLEPIVEWIVARIPLRAVKAWIAGIIRKLPPAATLIVFIVPVAVLFPFKLLGLWLLAHKQWIAASDGLVLAKLVGVAVTAFVFEVTRPKLLQLRLVPLALRARPGVARLGASPGRPDQAPDQEAAPHLPRETDGTRVAAVVAHPPPHARGRRRRSSDQSRCTACGANSPNAMKASPITPRPPARKLSATMPVMTVADASTMPIWKAADANS